LSLVTGMSFGRLPTMLHQQLSIRVCSDRLAGCLLAGWQLMLLLNLCVLTNGVMVCALVLRCCT
jgi:hypothetical protein